MSQFETSPFQEAHRPHMIGDPDDFSHSLRVPRLQSARFDSRSSIASIPLDISPYFFYGPREIPLSLRNPARADIKTSFMSILKFETSFFAESELDLTPFVGDVSLKWEADRLAIANAPYLFYDEHGTSISNQDLFGRRAETALRFSNIAPNALLLVRLRNEAQVRPALWTELIEPARATMRYIYSCMVNTDRYLRPLLEYAIAGDCEIVSVCGGKDGPELRVLTPGVPSYTAARFVDVSGPVPLVFLRAVAWADDKVAAGLGHFLDRRIATASLPGIITDGKFVGSGKYTPIEYGRRLRKILAALLGIGLLERCKEDGAVILTSAGTRLLDVLPPRMFDPDARLRWSDPETDLIALEHVEASERWLRSFYGEMRKVARRHCASPRFSNDVTVEFLEALDENDA